MTEQSLPSAENSGTAHAEPATVLPDCTVEILDYWREAGPGEWFGKNPDFDRELRQRFLASHLLASAEEYRSWENLAEGALALLILLDQFPRNAFRGTSRMYATDEQARRIARHAIAARMDQQVETPLRLFFYLPFAHSEELADQEFSVMLNRRLGRPWLDHAIDHHRIIQRFGRFPHRNPLLGRTTTAVERAFLDGGGFSG